MDEPTDEEKAKAKKTRKRPAGTSQKRITRRLELSGLTVEQEAKFEIAMAPVTSKAYVQQPATRRERPGRNEPCWCGSQIKYKKCHLEADERAARNE